MIGPAYALYLRRFEDLVESVAGAELAPWQRRVLFDMITIGHGDCWPSLSWRRTHVPIA